MKNRRSSKKKGGKKKDKKTAAEPLPKPVSPNSFIPVEIKAVLQQMNSDAAICRHGGTNRNDAIEEICANSPDWISMSFQISKEFQNEHPVDLYAMAASLCLIPRDGPYWDLAGEVMKAAILLEKNVFSSSDDDEAEKLLKIGWCVTKHCGSKRDVIVYLDQKIPCDCLKEMKKKMLQEPEIRCCCYCQKLVTKTMWCPNCESYEYCSKRCQLEHWSVHNIQCEYFCGRISMEDANQKLDAAKNNFE
ncbi:expressed unknown protein [Seminavis robusta]|uniref:MYND-type domain-containing protein n=1 Tax=Seminavis robusta TaxID=568900 RepID=A0A9N8HG97_9STRA|nr:expressed unknown protein [Seminavis robusta]|eukprot:Sro388_g132350.1 n/a (247) ;mRNA; f:36571-37311